MPFQRGNKTGSGWKVPVLMSGGGAATLGLKTNLVAWWELDEASGNRADSHTNALTLTDNNTVTSGTGIGGVGTAAQFVAANSEYLSRANGTEISTGDVDFTLAGWIYFAGAPAGSNVGIVSKWAASGNYEFLLYHLSASNTLRFYVSNNGSASSVNANSGLSPSDATWYFVVAQHDAVNNLIKLSVNDGAFATTSHTTGVFASTSPLQFGRNDDGDTAYFNGRMAKFGMWKSAAGGGGVLTASQITALYNGGAGRSYAEL